MSSIYLRMISCKSVTTDATTQVRSADLFAFTSNLANQNWIRSRQNVAFDHFLAFPSFNYSHSVSFTN